jgi:hypothetical protein
MKALHNGRVLKRWRYVGVHTPELSICVAAVSLGPVRQAFWGVWERDRDRQSGRESLAPRSGPVRLSPGRVRVEDGDDTIYLALEEREPVEVFTPYEPGYAWTAKQGDVPARGVISIAGEHRAIEGRAMIDDWAGYPPRVTTWRWSSGVGDTTDGRAVAWNLVDGVHDRLEASERTVWIDGVPLQVAPVSFEDDLSAVTFAGREVLHFASEAVRAQRVSLGLVRSDYEQPFGTFSGTLPGGLTLARGFGVMERHHAVW